jgi:threonylcarbamoyladenosine tRNA methylthiotransferase MtaB
MEAAGTQEVVLTGVQLGLYGKDFQPAFSLVALLDLALSGCRIPRIRLSSLEPLEVDDALVSRMRTSGRICPHLHVPLQSGDDEILRKMHRPYGTARYRERILRAASQVPDLTIGCDVIVGFPGETPAHFQNTLRFLQDLPFTYLHVFPFSPRPGTPAYHYTPRIPSEEIRARSQTLRALSKRRRESIMSQCLGRVLPVLVERPWKGAEGWMAGLTANYHRVKVPGGERLRNKILSVRMEGLEGDLLVGRCME